MDHGRCRDANELTLCFRVVRGSDRVGGLTGRHGAALRQRQDSQRMRTRAECNDARESSYALSATYTGKPLSFRENQSLLKKSIRSPRMNLHRAQGSQKRSIGVKKRVRSRCHGVFQQLRTFFDSTEEEIRTFPALCKHSSRWRPERVSTFRLCVSQRATLAF